MIHEALGRPVPVELTDDPRVVGRVKRLALVSAFMLGLALGTKFTGWLMPVPLLVVSVVERRWSPWLFAVVLALFIAWVFVPPAWHEPATSVARLFEESLSRDQTIPVATYYRGQLYEYEVPWHHAIVMTLITVPVGILAASVLGCADAAQSKSLFRPSDDRAALARSRRTDHYASLFCGRGNRSYRAPRGRIAQSRHAL